MECNFFHFSLYVGLLPVHLYLHCRFLVSQGEKRIELCNKSISIRWIPTHSFKSIDKKKSEGLGWTTLLGCPYLCCLFRPSTKEGKRRQPTKSNGNSFLGNSLPEFTKELASSYDLTLEVSTCLLTIPSCTSSSFSTTSTFSTTRRLLRDRRRTASGPTLYGFTVTSLRFKRFHGNPPHPLPPSPPHPTPLPLLPLFFRFSCGNEIS